jgi:ABC-2 type transport system permease protein
LNLWRLEWLRLVRPRRLLALVAVYLLFGFLGPFGARYIGEIMAAVGGDIQVVVPSPVPADGISQFVSNASQIGTLVVVIVAAAALGLDARTEMAVFLRTRVPSVAKLLLPRFWVNTAAAGSAFTLGALVAWYETVVLLGPLPPGRMIVGIALGVLYVGFAVGVVAFAAGLVRGTGATIGVALAFLLLMPVLALVPVIAQWLPSHLVGALDALAAGGDPGEYLRAAAVTVVATVLLLWGAVTLAGRREL